MDYLQSSKDLKMMPVVALIGHANVGKSTLFNQLTRTRDALVADYPKLTRDRKYGRIHIEGHELICIDTSSIDEFKKDTVETHAIKQSLLAIKEADIVLFIVDAYVGLLSSDYVIAKYLRSHEKSTILVVNKTDGAEINQSISDFWSLGFNEIHPISASRGHGITNLLVNVLLPTINKINPIQKVSRNNIDLQNLSIKLAIVGRQNVGKSTLTNRILGEERVVVYNTPGTTRDSIYISMRYNNCAYTLIDTAGIRHRNKINDTIERFSMIKTFQAIENANVVLMVIDAHSGLLDQDLSLIDFILSKGRALVIIVNKWDSMSNKEKFQVRKTLSYRLNFINFIRLHFISALYNSGSINNLFKSVYETFHSSILRRKTSTLTRIMKIAVKKNQPPLIRGRRVRLKYSHVGGYNPLIIVIHGNCVKELPIVYIRYLMNYFRNSLKIIGIPIFLQFKEGKNPYSNK